MPREYLMARQPIVDRKGRVVAFELLYRDAEGPLCGVLSEQSSYQALLNALVEIGLKRLVGDKLAFFNISASMLGTDAPRLFPHEGVVLEILEDSVFDAETAAAVESLRKAGYRIAYDDFTFAPHQIAFIGKVDIIKIDVLDTPWRVLKTGVPILKQTGAKLLAEKVENLEMHRKCKELGFDYFQGYFYARPEVLRTSDLDPNRQAILKLLGKLQAPDPSPSELEAAIAMDPSLATRLLKLVNSASVGIGRRVDSVRSAIQVLGIRRLQAFATVLAASSGGGEISGLLANVALTRAAMCEELARKGSAGNVHQHFTIGLLSVLDALLGLPMSEILTHLPLSAEVSQALLDPMEPSGMSSIIRLVLLHEHGQWEELQKSSFTSGDFTDAFLASVERAQAA